MTAGRAPFNDGDRRISANWLNDVDRVRRDHVAGADQSIGNGDQRITVLLVKKPVENDDRLIVRRVRYNTLPPQECDGSTCHYEYSTDEFAVYPDFGKKVIDYEDDAWEGTGIDDTATFLRAHWEDGTWRLEKPAASTAEIDYCVILQTSTPTVPNASLAGDANLGSFRLRVQRMRVNGAGRYEAKGAPLVVATRHNCPGTLYDDYRRHNRNGYFTGSPLDESWAWQAYENPTAPPAQLRSNMVTFHVAKADGLWVCEQPPPLVTRAFPTGTAAGCSVV